jgi:hypothetical protein
MRPCRLAYVDDSLVCSHALATSDGFKRMERCQHCRMWYCTLLFYVYGWFGNMCFCMQSTNLIFKLQHVIVHAIPRIPFNIYSYLWVIHNHVNHMKS